MLRLCSQAGHDAQPEPASGSPGLRLGVTGGGTVTVSDSDSVSDSAMDTSAVTQPEAGRPGTHQQTQFLL